MDTRAAFSPKGFGEMLVLSRYRNEQILIGDDVILTIVEIRGDKVRIGIKAPDYVTVHRREVYEAIKREEGEADGHDD
jgi:carbon storage regulator